VNVASTVTISHPIVLSLSKDASSSVDRVALV